MKFEKFILSCLKIDINMVKKHGGKRNNSGRKKLPKGQKKVMLSIYPTEEIVKKHGGMEKAKELCMNALIES